MNSFSYAMIAIGFILGIIFCMMIHAAFGLTELEKEDRLLPYCQEYNIAAMSCEMILGNIETGDYRID